MRFVFLGTGTSAGVPAIGCECAVCTSDDPRTIACARVRRCSSRTRKAHPRTILIDTGPDLRQQALRQRLTRCDAILYTHNHVDHTFGLDEVRRFNVVQDGPTEVYAEAHTMQHLRTVYKHIFERSKNVNDTFVADLIPHTIDPEKTIDLFGMRATPIRAVAWKAAGAWVSAGAIGGTRGDDGEARRESLSAGVLHGRVGRAARELEEVEGIADACARCVAASQASDAFHARRSGECGGRSGARRARTSCTWRMISSTRT
jgi:hypothetical protein